MSTFCWRCNGTGRVSHWICNGRGGEHSYKSGEWTYCQGCAGTGLSTCDRCWGRGAITCEAVGTSADGGGPAGASHPAGTPVEQIGRGAVALLVGGLVAILCHQVVVAGYPLAWLGVAGGAIWAAAGALYVAFGALRLLFWPLAGVAAVLLLAHSMLR